MEATVRQKREERNGRNRKPSSLDWRRRGRKEPERKGQRPKGKHSWNGCGSEARKGEKKRTAMPSTGTGKECMRNQAGDNGETEEARAESGTGEASVRRIPEEKERKHRG